MDRTALVIGSGFSSLSAACYLARDGYNVTILEKNGDAGGRARQWKSEGFTFDIGPTWYWMPDVFENFFADFGYSPSDFYTLTRLDPSYRIYFGENNYENIPASREGLQQLFEKHEPGSSSRLNAFLEEAATTYRLGIKEMALKPGLNPFEYISRDTLSHSHLFMQSLRTYVRKKFNHPYLISLLGVSRFISRCKAIRHSRFLPFYELC